MNNELNLELNDQKIHSCNKEISYEKNIKLV